MPSDINQTCQILVRAMRVRKVGVDWPALAPLLDQLDRLLNTLKTPVIERNQGMKARIEYSVALCPCSDKEAAQLGAKSWWLCRNVVGEVSSHLGDFECVAEFSSERDARNFQAFCFLGEVVQLDDSTCELLGHRKD